MELLLLLLRVVAISIAWHLNVHLRSLALVVLLPKEILILLRHLRRVPTHIHDRLLLLLLLNRCMHLLRDNWL